jgi:hypothetical protein
MKKNIGISFLEKRKIGEYLLVSQKIVSFGTKPGLLDKLLGEQDVRKRVINGENVDLNSDEYKQLCATAYYNFEEENKDNILFQEKLQEAKAIYDTTLQEAEENDKIKWLGVAANALLLGGVMQDFTKKTTQNSQPQIVDLSSRDASLTLNPNATNQSSWSELTSFQTLNDGLSWLSERSGGIPYGMLAFAGAKIAGSSLMEATQAGVIAGLSSAIPNAGAVMVGDEDYKTSVYCGPKVQCDNFESAAKNKKITLIESSKKLVTKYWRNIDWRNIENWRNIERLIVEAHGADDGKQNFVGNDLFQIDDFAASFFPSAKILHTIGCSLGANLQKNFKENSLKPDQILFIHAGESMISVGIMSQISSFLALDPNPQFPAPIPLQILFKENESKTIFAQLKPITLETLDTALKDVSEQRIDNLYNLITQHINAEKTANLKKFKDDSARDIIFSELERVGFRDHSRETDATQRERFVKNYLDEYLIAVSFYENHSLTQLKNIETILKSGLVDIDYLEGGSLSIAVAMGNDKLLEILIRNGANYNLQHQDGYSPIQLAAVSGQTTCLEKLIKAGANINLSDKDGATPAFLAANNLHSECLETLAQNKADITRPNKKGETPIFTAARSGCYKCVETLIKHGVELNTDVPSQPLLIAIHRYQKVTSGEEKTKYKNLIKMMIENGADMDILPTSTYNHFKSTDPNLAKELREIQNNYKPKPASSVRKVTKPASSVRKVKNNTLKKGADLEL